MLRTHWSEPEDEGCCDADCREERVGASVVSGCDAAPVLELGEKVFDFMALTTEVAREICTVRISGISA